MAPALGGGNATLVDVVWVVPPPPFSDCLPCLPSPSSLAFTFSLGFGRGGWAVYQSVFWKTVSRKLENLWSILGRRRREVASGHHLLKPLAGLESAWHSARGLRVSA